jgi:hypothetical protein
MITGKGTTAELRSAWRVWGHLKSSLRRRAMIHTHSSGSGAASPTPGTFNVATRLKYQRLWHQTYPEGYDGPAHSSNKVAQRIDKARGPVDKRSTR